MQVRITLTSAAGDETFAILNATPAEMEAYQKLAQVLSDNEEGAFAPHMEVEVVPPPPPDLPIPPPGDTFWVSTYGKGIVVASAYADEPDDVEEPTYVLLLLRKKEPFYSVVETRTRDFKITGSSRHEGLSEAWERYRELALAP